MRWKQSLILVNAFILSAYTNAPAKYAYNSAQVASLQLTIAILTGTKMIVTPLLDMVSPIFKHFVIFIPGLLLAYSAWVYVSGINSRNNDLGAREDSGIANFGLGFLIIINLCMLILNGLQKSLPEKILLLSVFSVCIAIILYWLCILFYKSRDYSYEASTLPFYCLPITLCCLTNKTTYKYAIYLTVQLITAVSGMLIYLKLSAANPSITVVTVVLAVLVVIVRVFFIFRDRMNIPSDNSVGSDAPNTV